MRNVLSRRTALCCLVVALGGLVLVALLPVSQQVQASDRADPGKSFVILLNGIYQLGGPAPDLGLSQAGLIDGAYSTTKIYDVSLIPGRQTEAIGTFYFNDATGDRCAYELPGGAFTALIDDLDLKMVEVPDGFLAVGTAKLSILEATGIYGPFVGGSIHMAFAGHITDEGYDEFCYCHISR